MRIIQAPSPNHNARPAGVAIDCVVLHATAGARARSDVEWCQRSAASLRALWEKTDPKRRPATPWGPVSYHAIIDRDGAIYVLVPTERRAWACGASEFLGVADVNNFSLSVAFANRQDGKEGFTDFQYQAGAALVAGWIRKHPAITPDRITDHATISPGRKVDPGPLFDWRRFRELLDAEFSCA